MKAEIIYATQLHFWKDIFDMFSRNAQDCYASLNNPKFGWSRDYAPYPSNVAVGDFKINRKRFRDMFLRDETCRIGENALYAKSFHITKKTKLV